MTKLESFIRTGALGPLAVGMSLGDFTRVLGEPPESSRKANPLLLRYGAAQFSFSKTREKLYTLREILITFQSGFASTPDSISFFDGNHMQPATEEWFNAFLERIDYKPMAFAGGSLGKELVFPSGVIVLLVNGMLRSIRYFEREAKRSKRMPVANSREPSVEQIREMLDEAERASNTGARRAALLLAWAALESVLRRRIQHLGGQSKIGLQPALLIHELFAAGELSSSEHRRIEELRQRRSSVAHGLAPTTVLSEDLSELRALVHKLMIAD